MISLFALWWPCPAGEAREGTGPWPLVPDPWPLVPGPWTLDPGPWPLALVPGPWPWLLVSGPWSLFPGPGPGSWSLAPGPWFLGKGELGLGACVVVPRSLSAPCPPDTPKAICEANGFGHGYREKDTPQIQHSLSPTNTPKAICQPMGGDMTSKMHSLVKKDIPLFQCAAKIVKLTLPGSLWHCLSQSLMLVWGFEQPCCFHLRMDFAFCSGLKCHASADGAIPGSVNKNGKFHYPVKKVSS